MSDEERAKEIMDFLDKEAFNYGLQSDIPEIKKTTVATRLFMERNLKTAWEKFNFIVNASLNHPEKDKLSEKYGLPSFKTILPKFMEKFNDEWWSK